tara:strand:+ start:5860 stop:6207 length:348 start_codon:yes stop_codon:yes gene_type:complete
MMTIRFAIGMHGAAIAMSFTVTVTVLRITCGSMIVSAVHLILALFHHGHHDRIPGLHFFLVHFAHCLAIGFFLRFFVHGRIMGISGHRNTRQDDRYKHGGLGSIEYIHGDFLTLR